MRVLEAAYRTVHNSEGGATEVAAKMGMNRQVLVNKANPANESHHLSLVEAVKLMSATNDLQILHELARQFKGVFLPLDTPPDTDNALITDISEMSVKFGKLVQEVIEDARDGVITATELNKIEDEGMRLRTALEVLLSHVRAMHSRSRTIIPSR